MATVFEKDLEFIQLLCNPEYIRWLHSEKYFSKEDFKRYIRYLLYFKDPKYYRFLSYPQCIPILEVLTGKDPEEILSNEEFYTKLGEAEHSMWKYRI